MKSPGRSSRKGISLIELFQMFPDDDSSERWFEECRWGKARVPDECPMCGATDKLHQVKSRKPLPYRCGSCRRYFSVKTSSVMHRSKIPFQKWAIAVYLWSTSLKGVSSMKLHRDLNIRQATAWFMAHRLREAWDTKGDIFFGPMEVDETFIGGKEGNKHAKKKLRAGRGGVGKASVVGAKDRTTKKIVARVVPDTKGSTLKGFVNEVRNPDKPVYSDQSLSYRGLPDHYWVNHSVGEYVRDQAHTNGMESFWSQLKRGYHGTFHHFSAKHLQRYVNEFAERHNIREQDTIDMMENLSGRMFGKRLTYADLIKDEE